MSADALDSLRSWIKINIQHGFLKPEIVIKDGKPLRIYITRGDEKLTLGMPDEAFLKNSARGVDSKSKF